jgi:hypothetical protein
MPDKKEPTQSLALIPRTTDEVLTVVKMFARSNLIPEFFKHSKNPEADLYYTISYGMDMGFSPVQSLRAICIINGKPGLYADAMAAKVMASGLAKFFRPVELTPEKATWETCRKREKKVHTQTFTIKEAKDAGIVKPGGNWTKWPQRMCSARAKSFLARDIYSEVLHGVYAVEELEDLPAPPPSSQDFGPVIDAASEVVPDTNDDGLAPPMSEIPPDSPDEHDPDEFNVPESDELPPPPEGDPSKPTLLERLEACTTIEELREVGVECSEVTDAVERQTLRDAWKAKTAEFQEERIV